jgi:murein DD-endopeptidase MepM/ murein hydrolase activator NlpD
MRRLTLVLLLFAGACNTGPVGNPFARATPHEQYAKGLEQAGLADTALARDWLRAAEEALFQPGAAALPLTNTVRHDPARPAAYGYRLQLQRGRVLRVLLDVKSEAPAIVFVDLFQIEGADEPPRHLASADRGSTSIEYEVRRDGPYVLRIQPELLRGGTLQIGQTTTAALEFPVQGRDSAAVRSFFLDPRDNNTRDHHGIDIFAPRNTPVLAAADGLVTSVGTNRLGGNVVWIFDPERGQSHYYAHLEKQAVTTGERVEAGDVVGYVGNTGNARTTPPHLHFGIYSRGEGPVNPLPFVATEATEATDSTGHGQHGQHGKTRTAR